MYHGEHGSLSRLGIDEPNERFHISESCQSVRPDFRMAASAYQPMLTPEFWLYHPS